ncbi:MAG: hypothetical protein D6798_04935 [Deltaproteobacteria bacterium]|nr:MAG: hypothetical protein D6798_04935 [Deltaproteobacteria bacterium]
MGAGAPGLSLVAQVTAPSLTPGLWMWAAFFAGLGAVVGAGLLWARRRPPRPARLAIPPGPAIAPRRVAVDQLDRLIGDRLAGYRVVLLGEERPGCIACLDAAVLPGELVAAVERLAAVAGPPVALVVAEPGRLEPPVGTDPRRALAAAVDGRFPLWVVDGPAEWEPLT